LWGLLFDQRKEIFWAMTGLNTSSTRNSNKIFAICLHGNLPEPLARGCGGVSVSAGQVRPSSSHDPLFSRPPARRPTGRREAASTNQCLCHASVFHSRDDCAPLFRASARFVTQGRERQALGVPNFSCEAAFRWMQWRLCRVNGSATAR
jgi:hypothetical protein